MSNANKTDNTKKEDNSGSIWINLVIMMIGGLTAVALWALFPVWDLLEMCLFIVLIPFIFLLSVALSAWGGYGLVKKHWNNAMLKGKEMMEETIEKVGEKAMQKIANS